MLCLVKLRFSLFVAAIGLIALLPAANAQHRGRKYKPPLPTARIEVTIVRADDGKPIENAAVIFHPMEGEKDKGNMELKTNEDGKALIDVMPIGDVVRLQIIANDYQTYGEDYKIDKAAMAIKIRLKRPGAQYSIYQPHPAGQEMGGKTGEPAMINTQTPKPIQGSDVPSAQPNTPPGQSQAQSQPQPK